MPTGTNLRRPETGIKRFGNLGVWMVFLALLLFWMLLSGSFDLQHLLAGVILSLLTSYLWSDLLIESGAMMPNIRTMGKFARYMIDLIIEVVIANIKVALIVLHPSLPISPGFIVLRTRLKTRFGRVIYANSITLTPGTLTVEMEGDRFIIHALTAEAAEGVAHWSLEEEMLRIEGGRQDG
ncbi:MAG: Na+/H+ antiporter subunit E [Bacillota bacterium]